MPWISENTCRITSSRTPKLETSLPMSRHVPQTLLCAAALVMSTSMTGCLNTRSRRFEQRRDLKSVSAEVSRDRPTLDESKVEEFGCELYWDTYIEGEVITTVTLQGRHLYAYTASNRLYQIDMQSGRVNWLFDVGLPLQFADSENPLCVFVYPPRRRKDFGRYDELFLVARDVLVAIDVVNGSELWRKRLDFAVSSPPSASLTHVYVGAWNDRVYAISKEDQSTDWFYRTDGDVTARPAAQGDSVFVSSRDGSCYRLSGAGGALMWPFKSGRELSADAHLDTKANLLYLPSDDFSLYVVNTLDGRLEWKHETGGRVLRQPTALDKTIYTVSQVERFRENRMVSWPMLNVYERKGRRFNKSQHEVIWSRKGPRQVLAASAQHVYCLEGGASDRKVVKLDRKEGFFRDDLSVTGVDFFTTNSFTPSRRDDKFISGLVFLGHRNGWIFALKEKPLR